MKVYSSFQRIVFFLLPVFLAALALIVATVLEVHGILRGRDVIIFLLGAIVLLLLLPYIVIPIHLRWTNWLRADQEYEAFHPGREVVPEEVWSHITRRGKRPGSIRSRR